jgi:sterol desaturase/sphingolipid hydroxylase (fatty acid hydroxylase superfamily)
VSNTFDYTVWFLLASFLVIAGFDCYLESSRQRWRLVKRWPIHIGLYICNGALMSLVPLGAIVSAQFAASHGFGLANSAALSPWPSTVLWIVAASLTQYGLHVASHRWSSLWAFHRVHHSDDQLDCTTGLRHHPAEVLWSAAVLSLLAVLTGVSAEIIAAWAVVELLFSLVTHCKWVLPDRLSNGIEQVLITPRFHAVHHSTEVIQTDSNYGTVFSLWDRLFGTCQDGRPKTYGLTDFTAPKNADFGWLLVEPFQWLSATFKARSRPTDQ